MPQCAFKNCANNHRNTKVSEGVSFFRFPTEPFSFAEWTSIVAQERGIEFYTPSKNSTICSIHFNNSDISGNVKRRRLLNKAIPKLQITFSTKLNDATLPTKIKTLDVSINSKSPTASFSDRTSLQDTPRKLYLKKQLIASRKIIEAKTKQIHNLHKINKRLKKNISSLKNIIHVLKNKKCPDDSVLLDLSKNFEVTEILETKNIAVQTICKPLSRCS